MVGIGSPWTQAGCVTWTPGMGVDLGSLKGDTGPQGWSPRVPVGRTRSPQHLLWQCLLACSFLCPTTQQLPPTPVPSQTNSGPGSHTCPTPTQKSPSFSFPTPTSRVPGQKPLYPVPPFHGFMFVKFRRCSIPPHPIPFYLPFPFQNTLLSRFF